MESIRVSGKTVDDALMNASIQLGTSRDNIVYTVIDEGSKGFFGIGGRKATIEAKKKVTDEDLMKEIFEEKPQKPKKETRRDEKGETRKDPKKESRTEGKNGGKKEDSRESGKDLKKESKQDLKQEKKETKDQKKDQKKTEKREEKKTEEKKTEKREGRKEAEPSSHTRSSDSRKEAGKAEQRESNKENRKPDYKNPVIGEEAKNAVDEPLEKTAVTDEEETRIPKTPADPEEAKQRAISFLSDILQAMGMTDTITAEFEDDILCVNIEGEDMGIMIGKRGQTLDSLQYLTSLVVNKGKASYTRVKVDTEDYRNRRKATLENLAKNIAVKVKKTRRPVFLEPMNPYERRIIHSALQNDPYVTTHSEGEEPYRKVVVMLKKDRERDDRDHSRNRGYSRYNNNRRGRYERGSYNRRSYDHDTLENSESENAVEQLDFAQNMESLDQSEE